MDPSSLSREPRRLADLGDERLAALAATGCAAAFEVIHARHRAALVAYCGRVLRSREDGEDAVQQTLLRAHRALQSGPAPRSLRPWLFAIARNRCLTIIAARASVPVPVADAGRAMEHMAEDLDARALVRDLLEDVRRLPGDQRAAIVLQEIGGLGHPEIAQALGCRTPKVRALVFQARAALTAEHEARETPCAEILVRLATARGPALRSGLLRRHLRQCEPCRHAPRIRPTPAAVGGSSSAPITPTRREAS